MISRKVIFAAIVIFVNILVLKICLGSFDVVSDIIKGFNYITGEFALGLYFASKTRAEYEEVRYWYIESLFLHWDLPYLLYLLFKTQGRRKWSMARCSRCNNNSHCKLSHLSLCVGLSLNATIYFQLNARSGGDGRGASRHLAWGILTLSFAWLPGLVVVIISATERQWDGTRKREKLSAVCGYILLILGWPLFAITM